MATHTSILTWRIYAQRSLVDYGPWSHKESDTTEKLTHTQLIYAVVQQKLTTL